MKKYLFMIAATCVVLACAKENIQNDATPDNVQDAKGNISFVVDVESVSDVKATISSNTNFTWETSDRAAVYTSEGTKVELTPDNISGGVATFTGNVPSGETVAEGAIVVYPASFLTASNKVTFPAEYTSNGQGTVLAAKVASGRKLTFKYLAATLKATITDVPSIATTIRVTSTETLTGEHTINFTGDTPALSTSSTAKTITFSSLAKGNTILVVPVPTVGTQTFTYDVNYSSSVLFTKSTTKTFARNSYMSMASLTINPSVYLIGDMTTGWSTEERTSWRFSNSAPYTTTLQTIGNQYFRIGVVYPTDVYVEMGSVGSDLTTATGTLQLSTDKAVRLSTTKGKYTIQYDNTTAGYSISKVTDDFYPYIIGTNYGSWNLGDAFVDANKITTKDFYGKYYKTGILGDFAFIYNPTWRSALRPNSTNDTHQTSTNSGEQSIHCGASNSHFGESGKLSTIIFSVEDGSGVYNYYNEYDSGQGMTMKVVTTSDNWGSTSEHEATKVYDGSGFGQLTSCTLDLSAGTKFFVKFNDNQVGKDRCYYWAGSSLEAADVGSYNFKIKDDCGGRYLFILNDKDGVWDVKIFRLS